MRVQAVLVAGDRGAARAIGGRSKAFVEIAGKPMVLHVLEALLHTPEVSEVFVVGDARRLERAVAQYGALELAAVRGKPIHIVPQRDSLYENIWHTFLRTLPPGKPDPDHPILVAPTDIPLVVPEEISDFVERALACRAGHVVGLSPEISLQSFAPRDTEPGISMACFNLAEGRFRHNNLHLVRPLRIGNRHYVQEVYENRYQKEWGNMLRLGSRILRKEYRNLWALFPYLGMHLAGVLDRRRWRRAADRIRSWVPLRTVERAIGAMFRTEFVTVTTALGGAAMDIDNAEDLAVAEKMIGRWKALQARMARGRAA